MSWAQAGGWILLSIVLACQTTEAVQPPDPIIRLTPEQQRRAILEFAEARIVSERSTISTPGSIQLNPAFTTVVDAPVAASSVTILMSAGDKVETGTILATFRPQDAAADPADPPVALRSPTTGTVVSVTTPGPAGVPAKSALMTISDLTRLLLVVSLPAAEGTHLRNGQTVAVAIDGMREQTRGHIAALSGRETTAGSVLEVALEVDDPQRRYRVGRIARGNFIADADHTPVSRLVIPSEAVASFQERDVVFVPMTETEFRMRTVTIEQRFGSNVYVQRGLRAGERVVTAGMSLLEFLALTQIGRE